MCLGLGGAKGTHPCRAAGLSLSTVPVASHPVLPTVPKIAAYEAFLIYLGVVMLLWEGLS